jgi:hypothetical protein
MTTSPGAAPDPHNEPVHDEAESVPEEEDVEAAKVDEQLDTSPEEARNFTDGYAPAEDPADPEILDVEDLED